MVVLQQTLILLALQRQLIWSICYLPGVSFLFSFLFHCYTVH